MNEIYTTVFNKTKKKGYFKQLMPRIRSDQEDKTRSSSQEEKKTKVGQNGMITPRGVRQLETKVSIVVKSKTPLVLRRADMDTWETQFGHPTSNSRDQKPHMGLASCSVA